MKYDVIIVGGGLAGLSTAALLASKGKKVALFEKGMLGGRAMSFDLKGFTFNLGAHAIYGRDQSCLSLLEKDLSLQLDWEDFSPEKANYDLGNITTSIPATLSGLLKTKILDSTGKMHFVWEIVKTVIQIEKGDPHISLKKWMELHGYKEDVKSMFLTLASSNFFTREPEEIPSDVFFSYYKRIFKTQKPVSYLKGGWKTLITELVRAIEEHGGDIFTKTKIQSVSFEKNRLQSLTDNKGTLHTATDFVFSIPPKEMVKLFEDTSLYHRTSAYARYSPSYVMYYDIGLSSRIDSPFTYIYDKQENIFLTDISYYDKECVPESGQLIQAIAYLNEEDIGDNAIFEHFKTKIEALYDKYFQGWRDVLAVNRISKQAIVQEIKWTMSQEALPVFFPECANLVFSGDWCQGQGQLSELSFSSAYAASEHLLRH